MQSIIALDVSMRTNIMKGRSIYSFEIICLAENTKAFRLAFGFFSLNCNWGWNLTAQRRKKHGKRKSTNYACIKKEERKREELNYLTEQVILKFWARGFGLGDRLK
jgi:hypothetical protein